MTAGKTASPLEKELLDLLANGFGLDVGELSTKSDLLEDVGLMSSVDELAHFVEALNDSFEIDLTPRDLASLCQRGQSTVQDLLYLIQDAQLA